MAQYIPNSKLQDKKWLYEQYLVKLRSLKDIAAECDVTVAVVSKYAKRYSFPIRNRGESRAQSLKNKNLTKVTYNTVNPKLKNREWLFDQYVTNGLSIREIATAISISNKRTVKRALLFHGIPIRDLKEARNKRSSKGPEFRNTVNPLLNDVLYLKSMYLNSNQSINAIQKQLNCSAKAIKRRLQNAGVVLRNCNEANVGRKHSIETITKMSKTASDQILNRTRPSHSNGHRVNCLTPNNGFVTMRSTWEKKYAEHLKNNNIDFFYEPKSFLLSNGKHYVADFYLPATDEYIEIKGYLSQDQSEKYELFKSEYPTVRWTILHKENLINLGIDLKSDIQTVYLLIGAPSAGKSWVANQLLDKFQYISYDDISKKYHLDKLREPSSKLKIYDPTFKISTIIRRHSNEFNFVIVSIYEAEEVLRERIRMRGGEWTETITKRNDVANKRFTKYGANGFMGTSDEVLNFLRSV